MDNSTTAVQIIYFLHTGEIAKVPKTQQSTEIRQSKFVAIEKRTLFSESEAGKKIVKKRPVELNQTQDGEYVIDSPR